MSLLRISRDRDGGLNVTGRAWQEDGTLSARYWSEAAKERRDPARHPLLLEGRTTSAPERAAARWHPGEIRLESPDRATGYWTTRSDRDANLNARTAGVYLRADPSDLEVLDGATSGRAGQTHRASASMSGKPAANSF